MPYIEYGKYTYQTIYDMILECPKLLDAILDLPEENQKLVKPHEFRLSTDVRVILPTLNEEEEKIFEEVGNCIQQIGLLLAEQLNEFKGDSTNMSLETVWFFVRRLRAIQALVDHNPTEKI